MRLVWLHAHEHTNTRISVCINTNIYAHINANKRIRTSKCMCCNLGIYTSVSREDSIKPLGVYLSQMIFRVGAYSRGGLI